MDSITTATGPAGQFRILVDLRGVSSANADVKAMRVAFAVLQKGYPCVLHIVKIIRKLIRL